MSDYSFQLGSSPALPEILLAIGALALLLFGSLRNERGAGTTSLLALVLLAFAFILTVIVPSDRTLAFGDTFVWDSFAKVMKLLALLGSAAAIALAMEDMKREGVDRFEFPILIILATIGMMTMISANSLIGLYLGVELLSLPSYVIASIHRDDLRSTESGVKYFILGALSSGMLLYGASLIYGFAGSVSFEEIATALQAKKVIPVGVSFGLAFMAAGVAFKVSAVPFHMWTPDVYEGAPTPVTAFFAAAPKMAGMAMIARLFVTAFPNIVSEWQQILWFVSAASMFLGAFAAIGQTNIKRLMAYSSIANVGYALMGVVAGTEKGIGGMIVYLAVYLAMTLGAFACILAMRNGDKKFENISDLAGLGSSRPMMAAGMMVIMFSLAGIPPLGGFFGKLFVFLAAYDAGLTGLVIVGALTSVVGAYYYLRIVKIMYFDVQKEQFEPMPVNLQVVLGACSAVILLLCVVPGPLVGAAQVAAKSLWPV